jgi:hypothetical protein
MVAAFSTTSTSDEGTTQPMLSVSVCLCLSLSLQRTKTQKLRSTKTSTGKLSGRKKVRSSKALSKNAHKQQQMLTEDQNDQSIKTLQQKKQKEPSFQLKT